MTTPNIEQMCEKLLAIYASDEIDYRVISDAAYQLQSQAERIKELETVPMKYRRMQFNAELQEENARLRAQIADIAATEPAGEMSAGTFVRWIDGLVPKAGTPVFTRPMPAQDVTELVEALETLLYWIPCNKARAALSKYKGAK